MRATGSPGRKQLFSNLIANIFKDKKRFWN